MKTFLILLLVYVAVTVVNILTMRHTMKLHPSKRYEYKAVVLIVAVYVPVIHLLCFAAGIIDETRMLIQTIIAKRSECRQEGKGDGGMDG